MNDCTFDKQALIDLINNVQMVGKQEYFYFCYREPSEEEKKILKWFGMTYKIIPNEFISNDVDENAAFIIPKPMCEKYIKLEFN